MSVVGDFNGWDGRVHHMRRPGSSGIWEVFLPGLGEGAHYRFELRDPNHRLRLQTDPCGMFFFEVAPKHAAMVWNNRKFTWTDDAWLAKRSQSTLLISTLIATQGSGRITEGASHIVLIGPALLDEIYHR